jgi:pimeloyl-ACP methyl ester carboxylesterase
MRAMIAALTLASTLASPIAGVAQADTERSATGTLADGADWRATVPANWNGTLLVWGHGYSFRKPAAEDAPANYRAELLSRGYALAGSTYATAGWALDTAPGDQVDTVAAFTAKFGKPKRVIAWGASMGALVTTAMVERSNSGIDGGIALCGSIGGAVGMMNMGLDGAWTFKTLLAPDSQIRVTGIDDDRANAARVATALEGAEATPQGRARVALAGVLAGIPGWTNGARPANDDYEAQQTNIAKAFVMGVFLPRTDQERRAGGNFSWNTGVDYRHQLALSGRSAMVRDLYRKAGLSLDADLATLARAKRVAAEPRAVAWMTANYTPNARPIVPLLAVQNIGDGVTSPSLQRAYADTAARDVPANIRALYVAGSGHCSFDAATVVDAIGVIEARIAGRRWPQPPARFVAYTPPPMLRPCVRGGACR